MDFRECVMSSVEDSQILAAFNRQEDKTWTKAELKSILAESDFDMLDERRRNSVARYLAFVHANIWRRVRALRSRRKAWYARTNGSASR